ECVAAVPSSASCTQKYPHIHYSSLLFLFCCALYAPAGMTYGKINNSLIVALLQTTTDEAAEFTGMIPIYHFLVSAAILVFMVIFWRTPR
ncbi:hypothetical protein AAIH01_33605, partial [Pseudomonas aeruginosa]|uniref:hypothetical protein n=1 Tax=Pseudomonas aeruginosa TaxID=287 RepID=UPI0031B6C627